MTTAKALPTPAEHDEQLRAALARLCLQLVAEPGDDLPRIVRQRICWHWRSGLATMIWRAVDLDLLWVLHAAALRAPSEAWLRVETVAEAARAVQQWGETDGCRDECDEGYWNPTGLACKSCAEWPHGALDEAVTALVHFVQREVSSTALDGITS